MNKIQITPIALVESVNGLDFFDDDPVLDIKSYPDWECGIYIVVNDFRVPIWLKIKNFS